MYKLRLILIAALAVAVVGCGSSSAAVRPTTAAKLIIVSPTPNQVTGPDVTAQFQVIGGTVLPPAQARGPIRGDQGHIHVSIDGKLIVMAFSDHADLSGLTPGPHALQAAWVATDHLPFANRVVASVLFQVQS
jgi:hypothetical protein